MISPKAQYYLAQADEHLKTANTEWYGSSQYKKLMELAREYRNLAAVEQGLPMTPEPDLQCSP